METNTEELYAINPLHQSLGLDAMVDVLFIVQASSFEQFELWRDFSAEVVWEQDPAGELVTIAQVSINRQKFPICLCLSFARLNGVRIAFYDPTSLVVHHGMVEEWLKSVHIAKYQNGSRWAHTDAQNFHNCIQFVKIDEAKLIQNELDQFEKEGKIKIRRDRRNYFSPSVSKYTKAR
jgi:hypothetical protein